MPQDPESAAGVPESTPARPPWWRSAIGWVRSHKILTALGLVLLWVLLEAATVRGFLG